MSVELVSIMFLNRYPIKIAILSALGYAIGDFLSLSVPRYIIYGILVSVTPTIGQSLQESFKRLFGIISGGLIAVIMVANWETSSISIVIGLLLTVLFCYVLNVPQIIAQAGITFCLVSIAHLSEFNQYYWERFIDNTMGVIMGTMANILLPPPLSAVKLQQGMNQILIQIGDLYQTLANLYLKQILNDEVKTISQKQTQINQTLRNNTKLLQSAKVELSQGLGSFSQWQQIDNEHRSMQEIILMVQELKQVVENAEQDQVYQLLLPEISYLVQTTYKTFEVLSKSSWSNVAQTRSHQEKNFSFPNLSEALANLDTKIEQLDITGKGYDYDLEQVIRLSAVLDELRAIANKLKTLSNKIFLTEH